MGEFVRSTYWRMLGALFLNDEPFQEIAKDQRGIWQAIVIVLLGATATALGHVPQYESLLVLPVNIVLVAVWWGIFALFLYFVGTWFLVGWESRTDFVGFLKIAALGMTPAVLRAFQLIPLIGPYTYFITIAWMLACMVVAVGAAFGVKSTVKVSLVIGAAMIPWIFVEYSLLVPR